MALGLIWDIVTGLPWTLNGVGSLEPRGYCIFLPGDHYLTIYSPHGADSSLNKLLLLLFAYFLVRLFRVHLFRICLFRVRLFRICLFCVHLFYVCQLRNTDRFVSILPFFPKLTSLTQARPLAARCKGPTVTQSHSRSCAIIGNGIKICNARRKYNMFRHSQLGASERKTLHYVHKPFPEWGTKNPTAVLLSISRPDNGIERRSLYGSNPTAYPV